eukprot:1935379-Amphidinium_carterae.1
MSPHAYSLLPLIRQSQGCNYFVPRLQDAMNPDTMRTTFSAASCADIGPQSPRDASPIAEERCAE